MNRDQIKLLGVVCAVALVLMTSIWAIARATYRDLLDEDALREAVASDTEALAEAQLAEERQSKVRRLAQTITRRESDDMRSDRETAKQVERAFSTMTPEEQALFIQIFLPDTLKRALDKFDEEHQTQEERAAKIDEIAEKMRSDFDSKSPEELWQMRQQLESSQGKAWLTTCHAFYQSQLDSTKRSEFAPMMRELLRHVEVLIKLQPPKQPTR